MPPKIPKPQVRNKKRQSSKAKSAVNSSPVLEPSIPNNQTKNWEQTQSFPEQTPESEFNLETEPILSTENFSIEQKIEQEEASNLDLEKNGDNKSEEIVASQVQDVIKTKDSDTDAPKQLPQDNLPATANTFGKVLLILLILLLCLLIGFFVSGVWQGWQNSQKIDSLKATKLEKTTENNNSSSKSTLTSLSTISLSSSKSIPTGNQFTSESSLASSQTFSPNSTNFSSQIQSSSSLGAQSSQVSQVSSQVSSQILDPSGSISNQVLSSHTSLANLDPDLAQMKTQVEQILGKQKPNFSVYFKNLKTGEQFDIDGVKPTPPASISKLPAAILTLKAAQDGQFSFKDGLELQQRLKYIPEDPMYNYKTGVEYPIGEYVRTLITGSDNTAMRHLEFLHGGTDAYNQKLSNLGIKLTRQPHVTTANDVANVFEGIYEQRWLNKANTDYLLKLLMTENKWNSDRLVLAMRKFPEAKVAHKIGQVNTDGGITYHDAGIIFGPQADFILVILNEDTTADLGITKIHEISQYLYKQLNQ